MSGDFISNHSNVRLIIPNAVVWLVLVSIMVRIMNLFFNHSISANECDIHNRTVKCFLYAFRNPEMLSDLSECSYNLGTEPWFYMWRWCNGL